MIPERAVTERWMAQAVDPLGEVTGAEASSFAADVVVVLDEVLFDPDVARTLANALRDAVTALTGHTPRPTRADVVAAIDARLRAVDVSHLRLLGPGRARELFSLADGGASAASLRARALDCYGLVAIESLLVPHFCRARLDEALEVVAESEGLIVDLRACSGGTLSAAVAVAERLVGPGRVVAFTRTRRGRAVPGAVVQVGPLDERDNRGSEADEEVIVRGRRVEWRTGAPSGARWTRPLVVLTGARTASIGEVLAAALLHAGVAVLGARTKGDALAAAMLRTSWPGHVLVAPFAELLSPNGEKILERRGVTPLVNLSEPATARIELVPEADRPLAAAAAELWGKELEGWRT